VREPEEVERLWFPAPVALAVLDCVPPEADHARLLRMKLEAKQRQTTGQRRTHLASLTLVLEADHEVVCVAHDIDFTARMLLPPCRHRQVERVVEVDVRQERADHPALRRPLLHHLELAVLHHACVQPFQQQPNEARIADPVLDELPHPFVLDRVEERADIGIEHPAYLPAQRDRQCIQSVVLIPAGPESVREAQEHRLVDRLQDHLHRLLDDLVLDGRDAERPRATIALRDVHTPYR
jgi:hypothetical protein